MSNFVNIFTILFIQLDVVFLNKKPIHTLILSSHSDQFKKKIIILAASLELKEVSSHLRSGVKW